MNARFGTGFPAAGNLPGFGASPARTQAVPLRTASPAARRSQSTRALIPVTEASYYPAPPPNPAATKRKSRANPNANPKRAAATQRRSRGPGGQFIPNSNGPERPPRPPVWNSAGTAIIAGKGSGRHGNLANLRHGPFPYQQAPNGALHANNFNKGANYQGTDLSSPEIDTLIATMPANFCGDVSPQRQRQIIQDFVNQVRQSQYSGQDVDAIMRTLMLGKPRINAIGRNRWDGGSLSAGTVGANKNNIKNQTLPSLMWSIVRGNCEALEDITLAFQQVANGEFGSWTNFPARRPINKPVNEQLAAFWADANGNGRCQGSNFDDVVYMLDLVDRLPASTVEDAVHTLALSGVLRDTPYRSNRYKTNSVGRPNFGTSASKSAILWGIIDQYCGSLPTIIGTIESILANGEQAGAVFGRGERVSRSRGSTVGNKASRKQQRIAG